MKSISYAILYFVLFVLLIFCSELPGFLSPYYWVAFGIVAAFFAAGPLTMCIHKTGSVLLLPIAWFLLNRAMGEIGMDLMQVGSLILMTAAAVVTLLYRDNKQKCQRICVPILVAMPSCNLLPLYFQTDVFGKAALEEMDAEYVSQLLGCAHLWVFALITICVIIAGIISQRLTERLFCK